MNNIGNKMKKEIKWIVLFGLILVLFAIFSTKLRFHDDYEYINIAKNFAGIDNIDLFSAHSLFYPLIISLFLKVWPSLTMMKMVNALWVFLIGIVILLWTRNEKAFILFAFSPVVWFMSIQTTPVLPSSFFLLLTIVLFYQKDLKFSKLYSGLCLGFSCALYTPMILFSGIFLLVYFGGNRVSSLLPYLVSMGIGFLPRIIQDYYLFKMPFYSLIRYAGANFIIAVGGNSETGNINLFSNLEILSVVFVISPLLFMLYKVDFRKYKKHLIFIGLSSIVLLLRVQQIKYFLIFTPLILILLATCLDKKQIKWHCVISLVVVIFMTWNFFIVSEDLRLQNELKEISEQFGPECILTGPFDATALAANHWKNEPSFIWWQDYEASLENKTMIKSYSIGIDPKIDLRTHLEIVANFNRGSDKTYKDCILVLREDKKQDIKGFELEKCYEELCVYEREKIVSSNSSL